MKELLLIAIGAALVNNVVLSQFLGLCPFIGVSKKTETAAGMGAAVLFVITIATACTSLIYDFVLSKLGIEYLQTGFIQQVIQFHCNHAVVNGLTVFVAAK